MGVQLGQDSLKPLECGVRVGWPHQREARCGSNGLTLGHLCTLIPFPMNLMQDLISNQKCLCRARICGYQPRPRWSISRELTPVSPLAAGCEILTHLEAVLLTLLITPGVFEVSG